MLSLSVDRGAPSKIAAWNLLREASSVAQAITVTDIRKNFGAVEALKRRFRSMWPMGEKVVVIGPSGSGKSVLIRCINGLEVPDSGTVVVEA